MKANILIQHYAGLTRSACLKSKGPKIGILKYISVSIADRLAMPQISLKLTLKENGSLKSKKSLNGFIYTT